MEVSVQNSDRSSDFQQLFSWLMANKAGVLVVADTEEGSMLGLKEQAKLLGLDIITLKDSCSEYQVRISHSVEDKAISKRVIEVDEEISTPQQCLRVDFSRRERDVIKLVEEGKRNCEIANKLCISTNTVKYHLRNLYGKLQATNRVQLVHYYKAMRA